MSVLSPEQTQAFYECHRGSQQIRSAMEAGNMDALLALDGHPAWTGWRGPTAGSSWLHMATSYRLDPLILVPFLLQQGLSLEELDGKGRSCLSYVFNGPVEGRCAWLKALTHAGLPVNHPTQAGQTAVSMAVLRRDVKAFDWLLEAGADATSEDHRQVRKANERELVERFWEAFGRPWSSEDLTRDLLDACHEGRWAHVDLLLDLGANALATDERGYTCLMLACSRARAPVTLVERLIALGVDVAAVANDDQGKPVSAKSLLAQHNQQQTSRSQRRLQEADEAMARGRQQWLESQYRHQATAANPRPRM